MGLVALTVMKEYLGIASGNTDNDGFLNQVIEDVSDDIETSLGRSLALGTYTEYFDIPDDQVMQVFLGNFPVLNVSSVINDGSAITSGNYVAYEFGVLKLSVNGPADYRNPLDRNYFVPGDKAVTVTYYAGYTTIPGDIQRVVKRQVSEEYALRGKTALSGERIGAYSWTRAQSKEQSATGLSGRDLQILNKYRRRYALE